MSTSGTTRTGGGLRAWVAVVAVGLGLVLAPRASEAQCTSGNPTDWPPPARPYFLVVVDTSSSLLGCAGPADAQYQFPNSCPSWATPNSCGLEPTRLNDLKCALQQIVLTHSGLVNFGLATYPVVLSGCPAGACADSCTDLTGACTPPVGLSGSAGEFYGCTAAPFVDWRDHETCGNEPSCSTGPPPPLWGNGWENGGNVVVPVPQDPVWGAVPPPSNVGELLAWVDGDCTDDREIFALGSRPLAGALRAAHQHLAAGWSSAWNDLNYCASGGPVVDQPTPLDSAQDPLCRSLNVILITDGGQTALCGGDPVIAAADLFNLGVTVQGQPVPVRTHVIGLAGVSPGAVDAIADTGDDGLQNGSATARVAANEVDLVLVLSSILQGATPPEECDNQDNNCNGCVDEGYAHFCNQGQTCCAWTNDPERAQCLASYAASIPTNWPDGDPTLLPCTDPPLEQDPQYWLCFDPGEVCDGLDNDCDGQVDNVLGAGGPCGLDVPPVCTPGTWQCLGGSMVCQGATWPALELCDGVDNDCDGQVDEPGDMPWLGQPCGHAYGRCTSGTLACENGIELCQGGEGPFPGECNGLDDDCDAEVDEPDEVSHLEGLPCGQSGSGEPGVTQCLGGAVFCVSEIPWSTEICDGFDNDCDGVIDNGAECPPFGGLEFYCVLGGCRRRCDPYEESWACGIGYTAQCEGHELDGETVYVCMPYDCGGQPCLEGWECIEDVCVDMCTDVVCEWWQICSGGACLDLSCTNYAHDCPQDEFCVDHGCVPDPCVDAGCGPLEACRRALDLWSYAAVCEPVCLCPPDQRCVGTDGCDENRCTDIQCNLGELCDPETGSCEDDPCTSVAPFCYPDEVCIDGECVPDPCNFVVCPTHFACQLGEGADGETVPICRVDAGEWVEGVASDTGCGCRSAGPGGAPPLALLLLLALGIGLRRWRRRRAHAVSSWTLALVTAAFVAVLAAASCGGSQDQPGWWNLPDGTVPDASQLCSDNFEVCDGIDNNCDGVIDNGAICFHPAQVLASCVDGTCVITDCWPGHHDVNGVVEDGCEYLCFVTFDSSEICDGRDNDCDGLIDEETDFDNDPENCGGCDQPCFIRNGVAACVQGLCEIAGCNGGFVDRDGFVINGCECRVDTVEGAVPCVESTPGTCDASELCTDLNGDGVAHCAPLPVEICDNRDNDCDGLVDEGIQPLWPVDACWVSPAADRPECTTQVTAQCVNGSWVCTFPAGVCDPSCAAAVEVCDDLDNNCDGQLNENVPDFGQPCWSDEGLPPPGHGACRTQGSYICNGQSALQCDATPVGCAPNCEELCDGIDNDCDGLVDEYADQPGADPAYYVQPAVAQVAADRWISAFEISRANATGSSAGMGNGYSCGASCTPLPDAPPGVVLEGTMGCSVTDRLPWFNVSPIEAEQVCATMGGFLCPTSDWKTACEATEPCTWGYSPRGAACQTPADSTTTLCNLGPYDLDGDASNGDQDGLLPTASPTLQGCWADWSNLLTNPPGAGVFDITGNLREITKTTPTSYTLLGGSFTSPELGATCGFGTLTVDATYLSLDTGFRCCWDSDPT